jgi:prevent-host-death family protein
MEEMRYSESREARFIEAMRRVCSNHEPIIIRNRDEPAVVLLSFEDYERMRGGSSSPASQ